MGDLLIRNLDDALKRALQERAKQSGRSLSEEAIYLIQRNLMADRSVSAGEWLRSALGDERLTEEEIAAIDALRHEPEREPPRFDE
ncbi:plasmid stabilization protein [Neorhizobium sp. CSC1952]|uniref:Plasmid stability protein n=1 Tax=Xaviernesmea oryzae TaxID=464029 RepID=A0A1X7EW82_9HYPH|nr:MULTISPECIES: plasmid stabilization protein [Rhizobium/Agrobacterium group]WJR68311.1 plasmid stabilization protein [Rhizobium sp. CSC1952]SMF40993.1 Plasmid stability protein [Xaviernesmea oryzae]